MSDAARAQHGVVEVPKECCWHTYTVTTSQPPVQVQRCCWCKAEQAVPPEPEQHGPYV